MWSFGACRLCGGVNSAAVRLEALWKFGERSPKTDFGGPKERAKGQLSGGNCTCKDMDTEGMKAPCGNRSGLVLVERALARDSEGGAGGQGPHL